MAFNHGLLTGSSHALADVPGGIVPDHQQCLLALGSQSRTDPGQELLSHLADRPPRNATQQHATGVGPQQPVTTQGFGVGVVFRFLRLDQTQGFVVRSGVPVRHGQATPPGLILITQHPVRIALGQPDQAVAGFFVARTPGRNC